MREKIARFKSLLIDVASDHLEYTSRASEAAIVGDEEEARNCQDVANSSLNTMISLQTRITLMEAELSDARLRLRLIQ
ncbi:hypothetical protein [Terribacillus saccharophilus]|uniref:hypothetical protein n=1 Tax=Terribacillus saccharophilus TaxID=361277 RepID=UPI002DC9BD89|nr:hypothetical protein [Terribacillus saccharophilus]MEC0288943.1 hypothetical protein [Terribacillus saccharophilus]